MFLNRLARFEGFGDGLAWSLGVFGRALMSFKEVLWRFGCFGGVLGVFWGCLVVVRMF